MGWAELQGWIANTLRRGSILAAGATMGATLAAPQAAQAHLSHRHPHVVRVHERMTGMASPAASGPLAPGIDWVVMDAATGRILSEHNAYNERYPASLTKLMTLDLAFQKLAHGHLSANTAIPVSPAAASVQPVKLNLVAGQTISVRQAMLGMTTLSANDAATALGQYLGDGSIRRVAAEMTARAHALGMERSEFRNPSGLPNPNQVTDAYDMAILARHLLLDYPQYRYLFSVPSFQFEGRTIPNIDGMLKRYDGAIGMKTGYTDLARFNLVTAAVRNGHMLIGVEMHAPSWIVAYNRMTQLLDAGFAAESSAPTAVIASDTPPKAPAAAPQPTVRQPAPARVLVASRSRTAPVHTIVAHSVGHVTRDMIPGWTAQVGAYDSYVLAKRQALTVRGEHKVGIARVGSAVVHRHRIWRAQIAGLDHNDANLVCNEMKRSHQSCFIIPPSNESLAMR
jgi:D-alanyl-D-alanine carboxypeptidase